MEEDRLAVEQVLSGDKESYRFLVDRYKDGLVRYCYSIVLDEAVAMDAAQQAFINAYQKLHMYKPKYAFSTWLYRIGRNEALKELKRLKRLQPIEMMAEVAGDQDLAVEFEKHLEAEKLKVALSELRHDWRQVIHFYYWEGKTYEEISELTGKPLNTVRVWLKRAKQKLEKELVYDEQEA